MSKFVQWQRQKMFESNFSFHMCLNRLRLQSMVIQLYIVDSYLKNYLLFPVLLMSWFGVDQVKSNSCIRTGNTRSEKPPVSLLWIGVPVGSYVSCNELQEYRYYITCHITITVTCLFEVSVLQRHITIVGWCKLCLVELSIVLFWILIKTWFLQLINVFRINSRVKRCIEYISNNNIYFTVLSLVISYYIIMR